MCTFVKCGECVEICQLVILYELQPGAGIVPKWGFVYDQQPYDITRLLQQSFREIDNGCEEYMTRNKHVV